MLDWLFGGGQSQEIPAWYQRERDLAQAQQQWTLYVQQQEPWRKKAAELTRGMDPHVNIRPLIEALQIAHRYGLEIVRPAEPQSESTKG